MKKVGSKSTIQNDTSFAMTSRSRVNSSNSSSTTSLGIKKPLASTRKNKDLNKENCTNNIQANNRKKNNSQKQNGQTCTKYGFRALKEKISDPKTPSNTINPNNSSANNPSKQKTFTRTQPNKALNSGRSTPRVHRNKFLKEQEEDQSCVTHGVYGKIEKKQPSVIVKDEIKRKVVIGNFKIGKKLRDSNFSATFLGVHIESGLLCGIKVYEKKVISEQGLEDQLISEIKIRLFMNHPNMVSLYTCFSDSSNIYLIEEPFPSSDTLSEQIQRTRRFSQSIAGNHINQLLLLVRYLHSEEIIHRDLRSGNMGCYQGCLKVMEGMWMTKLVEKSRRDTFCGTIRYIPPELLKGESYSYEIDMWNIGVILYELVSGMNPVTTDSLANLQQLNFPIFLSNDIVDLLGQLLIHQKQRMPLSDMFEHPWIKNNGLQSLINREFWQFWK